MNRNHIIAIIVAGVIVLAVGVAFGISYFVSSSNPTSNVSLLTVIDNTVQTRVVASQPYENVNGSQQIGEGWGVKTLETGRAIIEGAGSTTAIDKNAELTIQKQSNNKSIIQLTLGNVWANVVKKTLPDEGYEIHTPNAVATVRGTSFGVSYGNRVTIVLVQEGTVGVTSINPADGKQVGQEVAVTAGKKAIVEDGKEPVVVDAQTPTTVQPLPSNTQSTTPPATQQKPQAAGTANPKPTPTIAAPTNPTTSTGGGTSSGTAGASATPTTPPTTDSADQATGTPELKSALPATISSNEVTPNTIITVSGNNLGNVKQVWFNGIAMSFAIADDQTIKVNPVNQLPPGVYDISVLNSTGEKTTLQRAVTIR